MLGSIDSDRFRIDPHPSGSFAVLIRCANRSAPGHQTLKAPEMRLSCLWKGEIATKASSIFKPTVGAQLILEVLRRPGEKISDIVSA